MTAARFRRLNFIVLAAIIIVNLYTIATPFLPAMTDALSANNQPVPSVSEFIHQPTAVSETTPTQTAPADTPKNTPCTATSQNCLVIPRMNLDTPIVEGPEQSSYALLNKGAWRLPFSTTPDKGGNTVIAGHRFSYTGPRGIFYFLGKLQPGDEIALRWNGTLHTYKVENSRTVDATEVSVQQPTDDTRLTLYTCTPLINPVNRLVVVAKPVTPELPTP